MHNTILEIFNNANNLFITNDKELIISGVSERTLCGALSQYIKEELKNTEFLNYHVDVEYNRNNGKLKTIVDSQENIITINSDLIVHSRGENIEQDNLLAMEMKKSTGSNTEKNKDKERLKALTKDTYDNIWSYDGVSFPEHVCRYILGIYYEININKREILIEIYRKGELIRNFVINI